MFDVMKMPAMREQIMAHADATGCGFDTVLNNVLRVVGHGRLERLVRAAMRDLDPRRG